MGIFVADRKFLGEIGVLDEGMKVYGGENVELGIRVSKPRLSNIKSYTYLMARPTCCMTEYRSRFPGNPWITQMDLPGSYFLQCTQCNLTTTKQYVEYESGNSQAEVGRVHTH